LTGLAGFGAKPLAAASTRGAAKRLQSSTLYPPKSAADPGSKCRNLQQASDRICHIIGRSPMPVLFDVARVPSPSGARKVFDLLPCSWRLLRRRVLVPLPRQRRRTLRRYSSISLRCAARHWLRAWWPQNRRRRPGPRPSRPAPRYRFVPYSYLHTDRSILKSEQVDLWIVGKQNQRHAHLELVVTADASHMLPNHTTSLVLLPLSYGSNTPRAASSSSLAEPPCPGTINQAICGTSRTMIAVA